MVVTLILLLLTVPMTFACWILPFRYGVNGVHSSLLLFLVVFVLWLIRDETLPWWDNNRFSRAVEVFLYRLV